jgi:hypothetical protein
MVTDEGMVQLFIDCSTRQFSGADVPKVNVLNSFTPYEYLWETVLHNIQDVNIQKVTCFGWN